MSTTVLRLGRKDVGMRLSHAEFAEAQFDEPWRYERVQGRLTVIAPSGHEHAVTSQAFLQHLYAYRLERSSTVELVIPEAWLAVDDDTDRIVDIAVYLCGGRAAEIPYRVPDLIFEIVSPSAADRRRDYDEKRADFERIGVKEYAIVDRLEHRVTVLRLGDCGYRAAVLGSSDTYTTPLLPGLAIPLVEVL